MGSTIYYSGFSSKAFLSQRSFTITNVDVIKQDLLNHIWTIKGERLNMPDFGTRIPTLAFEPNDESTRTILEADIREVIKYDPRVKLIDLQILQLPSANAIVAAIDLYFIELDLSDSLEINISFNS